MKREHWRKVKGCGRFYKVSDKGRVMSLHFRKQRILKPCLNSRGDLVVCLSIYGKTYTVTVNSLVDSAFNQ